MVSLKPALVSGKDFFFLRYAHSFHELRVFNLNYDRCCFCIGSVMSGMLITNESFAIGRSYGRAALLEAFFLFVGACR